MTVSDKEVFLVNGLYSEVVLCLGVSKIVYRFHDILSSGLNFLAKTCDIQYNIHFSTCKHSFGAAFLVDMCSKP